MPFGQDNLRITLLGDTAWVVYDEWAPPPGAARIESFETRILERISGDLRIVYAA